MADLFAVLADPARRALLEVLLDTADDTGETTEADLVAALALPADAVAAHVDALAAADLVLVRDDDGVRRCSLDVAPLAEIEEWVATMLSFGAAAELDPDDAGSFVFAAWSGAPVRSSLRRAAGHLPEPGEVGEAVGRRIAETRQRAAEALHEASARVEKLADRLPPGLAERLPGRRPDGE